MKQLIIELENLGIEFNMDTKLNCYILAIKQNDPYSAIGIASLYKFDQISPTFSSNLKIIALANMRKFPQAFRECELIVESVVNKFTNEGCFFLYTVTLSLMEKKI